HSGAPVARVLVHVLAKARMLRFVHEGQPELRQVDEINIEAACLRGKLVDPAAEPDPDSLGPGASYDDLKPVGVVSHFWGPALRRPDRQLEPVAARVGDVHRVAPTVVLLPHRLDGDASRG